MDRRGFLKTLAATGACSVLSPGLKPEAATAAEAKLVRYPYLQNVRGNAATILWTAAESGFGTVEYSTDQNFSSSAEATIREFSRTQTGLSRHNQYEAELTGLAPNTEYFYRIMLDGQDATPRDKIRFRTAGPGPFNFLVFGDAGMGTPQQLRLSQLKTYDRASLVLLTGDIVYPNGTFAEYQYRYFSYYRNLMKRVPFFPSPGNHDYETDNAAPYLAVHSLPGKGVPEEDRGRYYSFDWSNVHFVALDTMACLASAASGTGRMLQWLDDDLAKTRKFWRVVYFHHPPYATGPNESDPVCRQVREYIVPILEKHNVELVFNGHEHSYQRSQPIRDGAFVEPEAGTTYITTGGGGAFLYPVVRRPKMAIGMSAHHYMRCEVQGHRMRVRAIRANGREIDSFTLAPLPVIDRDATIRPSSFSSTLAPKLLLTISGRHLAPEDTEVTSLPLPTELAGTVATLDGQPLPLLYVSSTEIIAPMVTNIRGRASLRINTPNGWTEAPITISD